MIKKDSANQPNSNFRLQEGSTRKLDKTYNTREQQQLKNTATILNDSPSNPSKLNKQNSKQLNHSNEELRQKESTVSKLEKPLNTSGQQQLNQTTSVLTESTNTQSIIKNTQSTRVRQQYSTPEEALDYKTGNEHSHIQDGIMKKQYSELANDEFRKQESTARKVGKVFDTSSQKQLNQTTTIITENEGIGDGIKNSHSPKVRQQFPELDNAVNSLSSDKVRQKSNALEIPVENQEFKNNNSKLEKAATTESFLQIQHNVQDAKGQDNNTSQKNVFVKKQIVSVKNGSYIEDNSFRKKKYKLQKRKSNTGVFTIENPLQSSVKKYQTELEKDDEGVKLASQSSTVVRKISAKVYRRLKLNAETLKKENDNSSVNRVPDKLKSGKVNFVKQIDNTTDKATPNGKFKPKDLNSKNFSKSSENPLSLEKANESSLKKISTIPMQVLNKSTIKYQSELEKDDEGVKLVSQGATALARASKKLSTAAYKINGNSKKLATQSTKLKKMHFTDKKKLKVDSKNILQKKALRKRMYAPLRDKNKQYKEAFSSVTNRIINSFKKLGKFKINDVKKLVGAKIAAVFGGGLISVLPFFLVGILCLLIVGMLGSSHEKLEFGGTENINKEVRRWCPLIEQEAKAQGMEEYTDLIASIVQVESGGSGTKDIMQSSESAGYPPNYWKSEVLSIKQGVKHLKGIVNILKGFNAGYENNTKLLAQAYNFGSPFARYVGNRGGSYSLDVAEAYSKEVVAPSLGNFTGETYSYINDTSLRLGKPYLYRNGGNFMYGELVGQYGGCSGSGAALPEMSDDFEIVLNEILKYEGMPYVWGGKTPKSGFDCSGLISWGMKKNGVNLPSYSVSQYNLTVPIKIDDAQPGDLIFFKGTYGSPNQISHVEFYIDNKTMYGSNGSGVGYHNWRDDPYWQKHFAGIRRIVK